MEQNARNYNHGHYAAQNREEMGEAISRHSDKLDARQFGEMLDLYDKEKWLSLPSTVVSEPLEMIKKLQARRDKKENTTETGLRECCDFLNNLITLLRT